MYVYIYINIYIYIDIDIDIKTDRQSLLYHHDQMGIQSNPHKTIKID